MHVCVFVCTVLHVCAGNLLCDNRMQRHSGKVEREERLRPERQGQAVTEVRTLEEENKDDFRCQGLFRKIASRLCAVDHKTIIFNVPRNRSLARLCGLCTPAYGSVAVICQRDCANLVLEILKAVPNHRPRDS